MEQKKPSGRMTYLFRLAWLGIVVLALGLRVVGLSWGLPEATHIFSYHPDEFHSLRGAFSALLGGDLNPHFFNYGSLYLYLVTAAIIFRGVPLPAEMKAASWAQMMRDWTLAARCVNVLCGVLTVFVVYLLAREAFGKKSGLAAAALLAALPLHVLHSHYATVDVPQTLFIALTLFFALRLSQKADWRNYIYAGLGAGLAASTKYNGALVLLAPLLAHGLASRQLTSRAQKIGWPVLMGIMALLAFAATSPYTFLDWAQARQDILFELEHMRQGEEPARSADPNGLLFHLWSLTLTSGGATIAALGGLVLALKCGESRKKLLPILLFAVAWLVMISLAKVRYGRYEIALAPVLAFFVGGSWAAQERWGHRSLRRSALFLAGAAGALSLMTSAALVWRLHKDPDPRDVALQALLRFVPPDRSVGLVWDVWFNAPPVDVVNGGAVLRQNPLWRPFRQPLRPLVITGLNAEALEQQKPFAFVLSNFEIRDALRIGLPGAKEFVQKLRQDYELAFIASRPAPLAGLAGWRPPQDWLYPFPEIHIYLLPTAAFRLP